MSTPARRATDPLREPLRFGVVGIANTVTGLAVITAALAAGMGDLPANALGYAVGLLQGFALNRRWTFRPGALPMRRQFLRYLAAFAPAYGLNLLVVAALVAAGVVANPLTHLLAVAAYTVAFYLLCTHFVFKGPARPVAGPADATLPTERRDPSRLRPVKDR